MDEFAVDLIFDRGSVLGTHSRKIEFGLLANRSVYFSWLAPLNVLVYIWEKTKEIKMENHSYNAYLINIKEPFTISRRYASKLKSLLSL